MAALQTVVEPDEDDLMVAVMVHRIFPKIEICDRTNKRLRTDRGGCPKGIPHQKENHEHRQE
jgi:hypothetical protein